mmetsp:Transcript_36909/g.85265  ORF Transcript_36909/g.85265 Transcript_36909/m.85265 type:complete len:129 (+) Transcript_36909:120-506(+)
MQVDGQGQGAMANTLDGTWKGSNITDTCCCETATSTVTGTGTDNVVVDMGPSCCCLCCSSRLLCNLGGWGSTLNLSKADADAGSEGQRWQDAKGSYLEMKDGKLTLGKWCDLGDSAGGFVIQQWKMER